MQKITIIETLAKDVIGADNPNVKFYTLNRKVDIGMVDIAKHYHVSYRTVDAYITDTAKNIKHYYPIVSELFRAYKKFMEVDNESRGE